MSETKEPVFIAALDYTLGEEDHDLDELTSVLPGIREALRESGVERYRTSAMSPMQLAGDCMQKTLQQVPTTWRGEIRHLIYATNSVWDSELLEPRPLGDLLLSAGLEYAYPYGIFMSYCANLQCAFDLGASLIRSDKADHVVVVCTDKAEPKSDRLVRPRISIHSDGAASFIMTRERREHSYQLLETVLTVAPTLGAIDADVQFIDYLNGITAGVVNVVRQTLDSLGIEPSAVAMGFTNNYNCAVATMMGKLAGFGTDQLYLVNVPRFAHALAADAIINIADWAKEGGSAPDRPLVMLSTGPIQWGCSVVTST